MGLMELNKWDTGMDCRQDTGVYVDGKQLSSDEAADIHNNTIADLSAAMDIIIREACGSTMEDLTAEGKAFYEREIPLLIKEWRGGRMPKEKETARARNI